MSQWTKSNSFLSTAPVSRGQGTCVASKATLFPVKKNYQFKKADDPLYIHYSLWSLFSMVNTALVDDPDVVIFIASTSFLVGMSLVAKLAPEEFNPEVAKTVDKWVIGVSGVRDISRIMSTFALGYWALSWHVAKKTIQDNATASDILLGAAADPLFWIMTGVIGIANGVMKYKAKANPEGLSSTQMAKLEKGVRGAYMACSTSTMAIFLLDGATSLLSNATKSGYGLLLAEPITAAITFAVIATVAVAGIYCGIGAQRAPESVFAKRFDKCDKTLGKVRKIFMPTAVIASLLLCPELIVLGAVLTVASLLYDKYRQKKNTDKVLQKDTLQESNIGEQPESALSETDNGPQRSALIGS